MKISNGERIHRNNYTVIPMPDEVVEQIHRLAKSQKFLKEGLEFRNRRHELIVDDVADDAQPNSNITGVERGESESDSDYSQSDEEDDDDDDDDDKEEDEADNNNKDRRRQGILW